MLKAKITSAVLAAALSATALTAAPSAATVTPTTTTTSSTTTKSTKSTDEKTLFVGDSYTFTLKNASKSKTSVSYSKKNIVKATIGSGTVTVKAKKAGTTTLKFKNKSTGKVVKTLKITVKASKTANDNFFTNLENEIAKYPKFTAAGTIKIDYADEELTDTAIKVSAEFADEETFQVTFSADGTELTKVLASNGDLYLYVKDLPEYLATLEGSYDGDYAAYAAMIQALVGDSDWFVLKDYKSYITSESDSETSETTGVSIFRELNAADTTVALTKLGKDNKLLVTSKNVGALNSVLGDDSLTVDSGEHIYFTLTPAESGYTVKIDYKTADGTVKGSIKFSDASDKTFDITAPEEAVDVVSMITLMYFNSMSQE